MFTLQCLQSKVSEDFAEVCGLLRTLYFNLNTYLNFLDYQSGRGDSNRNEMAKNFMEDYNPSYFGGRGFKSVGKDL